MARTKPIGQPMSHRWADMVRAEHDQAERVRHGAAAGPDYWKAFAHRFAPVREGDSGRDPSVEALLELVRPTDTVLDVGAGGGRIALPLAQKCAQLVAVEPSESMRQRLSASATERGVKDLTVVAATWEEAQVGPADVVVCSHVLYTVADPAPFVQKLNAHARRLVAVIVFDRPAASTYFPLWPLVHGEARLELPCLREFEALLKEMGIRYQSKALPPREPRGFDSADQAIEESMARLFVAPGTPLAAKLERAVRDSLVPYEGGVRFKWAAPQTPWLVTWSPPR